MNFNTLTRSVTAVALLGALTACDNDLTEINQNPNNPEVVPVEAVLSSAIWDLVANNGGRGTHGEWTSLYHLNTWAQHTAQSAYNDQDHYVPREGINENMWSEMYAGPLTDLQNAQDIAVAAGDQNLVAVTDILMVYGFLFLTDTFGDIPYFQALNLEEYPQPEFTPQEQIYPDMLDRLEAAVAQINTSANPSWGATGDLLYHGNMDRWQEFANGLRMRIAMRTSETGYASTAASKFATAWNGNRFDSNADNASLEWTGTLPSQNPLYEQIVLGGRTGDFRVSGTLEDYMSTNSDPRVAVYMEPAASDGVYRGLPNGYLPADLGLTVADFSTIGTAFIAADAPSVLQSYAEQLFLGAEAAALGWIAGDPVALCAQAVTASFAQYGLSAGAAATYLAGNPCTTREDILTEKWVALFLLGPESYADIRRTGYPDLPLPFDAAISQLPARMPYPPNEALYNENFAAYASVPYTEPLCFMP